MILRSRRYRVILGFTLGFLLCLVVSGLGFYWYLTNEGMLSREKLESVRTEAVNEYIENNPTGLIYILASDKKQERY